MPKFLIRIVAFLLVPCLVMDPALARGFASDQPMLHSSARVAPCSLLEVQAMAPRAEPFFLSRKFTRRIAVMFVGLFLASGAMTLLPAQGRPARPLPLTDAEKTEIQDLSSQMVPTTGGFDYPDAKEIEPTFSRLAVYLNKGLEEDDLLTISILNYVDYCAGTFSNRQDPIAAALMHPTNSAWTGRYHERLSLILKEFLESHDRQLGRDVPRLVRGGLNFAFLEYLLKSVERSVRYHAYLLGWFREVNPAAAQAYVNSQSNRDYMENLRQAMEIHHREYRWAVFRLVLNIAGFLAFIFGVIVSAVYVSSLITRSTLPKSMRKAARQVAGDPRLKGISPRNRLFHSESDEGRGLSLWFGGRKHWIRLDILIRPMGGFKLMTSSSLTSETYVLGAATAEDLPGIVEKAIQGILDSPEYTQLKELMSRPWYRRRRSQAGRITLPLLGTIGLTAFLLLLMPGSFNRNFLPRPDELIAEKALDEIRRHVYGVPPRPNVIQDLPKPVRDVWALKDPAVNSLLYDRLLRSPDPEYNTEWMIRLLGPRYDPDLLDSLVRLLSASNDRQRAAAHTLLGIWAKEHSQEIIRRLQSANLLRPLEHVLPTVRGEQHKVSVYVPGFFFEAGTHDDLVARTVRSRLSSGSSVQVIPHYGFVVNREFEQLVDHNPDTLFIVALTHGSIRTEADPQMVNGDVPIDWVRRLGHKGVIFVISAGNDDQFLIWTIPRLDNVLYIAAADKSGEKKAELSNFGLPDDLYLAAAPPHAVPITGTSAAAPEVAAELANLLEQNMNLSEPDAIKELAATAKPMNQEPLFKLGLLGKGLLPTLLLGIGLAGIHYAAFLHHDVLSHVAGHLTAWWHHFPTDAGSSTSLAGLFGPLGVLWNKKTDDDGSSLPPPAAAAEVPVHQLKLDVAPPLQKTYSRVPWGTARRSTASQSIVYIKVKEPLLGAAILNEFRKVYRKDDRELYLLVDGKYLRPDQPLPSYAQRIYVTPIAPRLSDKYVAGPNDPVDDEVRGLADNNDKISDDVRRWHTEGKPPAAPVSPSVDGSIEELDLSATQPLFLLRRISALADRVFDEDNSGWSAKKLRSFYEPWRKDPSHNRVWVFKNMRGRILGFAHAILDPYFPVAQLETVAVDGQYEHMGIGTALFEAAMQAISRVVNVVDLHDFSNGETGRIVTQKLSPELQFRLIPPGRDLKYRWMTPGGRPNPPSNLSAAAPTQGVLIRELDLRKPISRAVRKRLFDLEALAHPKLPRSELLSYPRFWQTRPDSFCVYLAVDTKGIVQGYLYAEIFKVRRRAELMSMAVDPTVREQNIATSMVETMMRKLAEMRDTVDLVDAYDTSILIDAADPSKGRITGNILTKSLPKEFQFYRRGGPDSYSWEPWIYREDHPLPPAAPQPGSKGSGTGTEVTHSAPALADKGLFDGLEPYQVVFERVSMHEKVVDFRKVPIETPEEQTFAEKFERMSDRDLSAAFEALVARDGTFMHLDNPQEFSLRMFLEDDDYCVHAQNQTAHKISALRENMRHELYASTFSAEERVTHIRELNDLLETRAFLRVVYKRWDSRVPYSPAGPADDEIHGLADNNDKISDDVRRWHTKGESPAAALEEGFLSAPRELPLVFKGQGLSLSFSHSEIQTQNSLRQGQEGQLSVRFYEVYEAKFSPAAEQRLRQAVDTSEGKLVWVTKSEIIAGHFERESEEIKTVAPVMDNALAVLDKSSSETALPLSAVEHRLLAANYGDWRERVGELHDVRISAAGLIRIKVGDQYMLIHYGRMRPDRPRRYIPVGGAVEYTDKGRQFLQSIGAYNFEGDDPNNPSKDLRFFLPVKQLDTFEQWFRRRVDREIDPLRELREELVDETGAFSASEFERLLEQPLSAGPARSAGSGELATDPHGVDAFAQPPAALGKEAVEGPGSVPATQGMNAPRTESGIHFIYATHDTRQEFDDIQPVLASILTSAAQDSRKVHIFMEGDLVQFEDLARYGLIQLLGEIDNKSGNSAEIKDRVIQLMDLFFRLPMLSGDMPEFEVANALLASLEDPLLMGVYDRLFDEIGKLKPWRRLREHMRDKDRFYTAFLEYLRSFKERPKTVFRHLEILGRSAQRESLRGNLQGYQRDVTWDLLIRSISQVLRLRQPPLIDQIRALRKSDPDAVVIVIRGSYHREDHRPLVEVDRQPTWVHSYPSGYFDSPTYELQRRFIRDPNSSLDNEITTLSKWSNVERVLNGILKPAFTSRIDVEIAVNSLIRDWRNRGLTPEGVLSDMNAMSTSEELRDDPVEISILNVLENPDDYSPPMRIVSQLDQPDRSLAPIAHHPSTADRAA